MKTLWRQLGDIFERQRQAEGALSAALMLAGAVRAALLPGRHLDFMRLEIFDQYVAPPNDADRLFPLSHRHYLAIGLTHRERLACAVAHYRHEQEFYDSRYKEAVYRGSGVELWQHTVDTVTYRLTLRASPDLRHEGGISVVLCADAVVLCEMSFAWVQARTLRLGGDETIPFVTRNQSIRRDAPALARFRRDFPQNSPPYYCLAAVHGVVEAHGIRRLAGIRHDRQVAFDARHASSFHNSYCGFWRSFDAEGNSPLALLMPVPLAARPIQTVQARHRKRALERRRRWADIARGAGDAIAPHLRAAPARSNGALGRSAAGWLMPMQAMWLTLSTLAV